MTTTTPTPTPPTSPTNTAMTTTTKAPRRSSLKQEYYDYDYFDNRTVCFGNVEIIEFPRILGDNPAVSCGVPLSIDWKQNDRHTEDIDVYEYLHPSKERKRPKELVLSVQDRVKM